MTAVENLAEMMRLAALRVKIVGLGRLNPKFLPAPPSLRWPNPNQKDQHNVKPPRC